MCQLNTHRRRPRRQRRPRPRRATTRPRQPAPTSRSSPSWRSPATRPRTCCSSRASSPTTARRSTRSPPRTGRCAAVVGFVDADRDLLQRRGGVRQRSVVQATYHKRLLPNYAVFDEQRVLRAGRRRRCARADRRRAPSASRSARTRGARRVRSPTQAAGGAELVVNLNASPYYADRWRRARADAGDACRRRELCRSSTSTRSAARTSWSSTAPRSCSTRTATCSPRAPQFEEDGHRVRPRRAARLPQAAARSPRPVDRARPARRRARHRARARTPTVRWAPDRARARARARGLRGARARHARLRPQERLHRRRSSASPAASTRRSWRSIAADALGAERVHGVSMPSRFSIRSLASTDAGGARRRARHRLPHDPDRAGPLGAARDARLRRSRAASPTSPRRTSSRASGAWSLMALSNKFRGWLVLTTGNKSEMAVGYSTLYGDTAGGFAVIKDVPKTARLRAVPRPQRAGGARPHPERCSPSRRRPSCDPTSATTSRCRPTRCSTRSSRPTSRTTAPAAS